MKVLEVLNRTTTHFQKLGFERPRFEAEMVLSAALKWKRMDLFLKFELPLQTTELQACRDFVLRRSKGEPLAYIEKSKEFYGLDFYVDQNVLIPRPETEMIVELSLERFFSKKHVLDIGCGSGCIALSILKNLSSMKATLVDVSGEALNISKKNAEGLEVFDRCSFAQMDFYKDQSQTLDFCEIDLVVSNPPYIANNDPEVQVEVREYEPHIALFSENAGLKAYQEWSKTLAENLISGAHLIYEIGYQQGQAVENILNDLKVFKDIEIIKDYSGKDRIIIARKE